MLSKYQFESAMLEHHIRCLREEQPVGHFALEGAVSLIGGISGGRMTFITGEPVEARSVLLGQLSDEAAEEGCVCVFATPSVDPKRWVAKSLARVSNLCIRESEISDPAKARILEDAVEYYQVGIAPRTVFLESPMTVGELMETIEAIREDAEHPVALFLADLGFISGAGEESGEEARGPEEAVAGLRRLANAFDIPVFVAGGNERPREAYAAELMADVTLRLSLENGWEDRHANAEKAVQPFILKRKQCWLGPQKTAKLTFFSEYATFADVN